MKPWDRKRAAHLHRRAGFGGSPEELDLAVDLGRESAVARLVDYEAISAADLDAYLDLYGFNVTDSNSIVRWWYFRMQYTPRPLEEKMTLFWHNHFATSIEKVDPVMMYVQNTIFRKNAMGKFGDLLFKVSIDPAMLIWLDNATNTKRAPNENFAREVMELFTMGIGTYTQKDVTAAARAFTGWTLRDGHFFYAAAAHDSFVKTFLGNSGFFFGKDILDILAARPETAAFITRKLSRFFIGADPSPELWARLQQSFTASEGDIREIVRQILLSEDFDASADHPDVFKSPVEILVGIHRSLRGYDDPQNYLPWPAMMGQALLQPPNVAGWKGGEFWMNTGSYLARIRMAYSLVNQPPRGGDWFRWDIGRFFEGRRFATANELIDFLADRFNLASVSDVLRETLRSYLAPPGQPFTWTSASFEYFGRGAIYLVLASPEYQLQ
jgi:uncharacterized protein (DUF1800 family)